jgi:hypothetical protein
MDQVCALLPALTVIIPTLEAVLLQLWLLQRVLQMDHHQVGNWQKNSCQSIERCPHVVR